MGLCQIAMESCKEIFISYTKTVHCTYLNALMQKKTVQCTALNCKIGIGS